MNSEKPRCCILDVDGTLIDCEKRFKLGQKGSKIDWNFILNPDVVKVFDKPMPPEIINTIFRLCCENNCEVIVVLTGRPERLREVTVQQLQEIGLKDYILIMRKDGDYRKELDYKIEKVYELSRRYDIVAVFDDNPDVLKALSNILPHSKLYLVRKDGVSEYRSTGLGILAYLLDSSDRSH